MSRKVLIGTPSYDGRLEAWHVAGLIGAAKLAFAHGVHLDVIHMSYDALVQRARNDLIAHAINHNYDELIFIDSDMVFDPQWIIDLLLRKEDVIGGTCRKKTDDFEAYSVKTQSLEINEDGLIKVDCIGTGFIKLSRNALVSIWNSSQEYVNEGKVAKMVCSVEVIDGELYSEDRVLSRKLHDAGFDIWLVPYMTCGHVGSKMFRGNFLDFVDRVKSDKEKQKEQPTKNNHDKSE